MGLLICMAALASCTRQTVLVDSAPVASHPAVQIFDQHGLRFEYPGAWLQFPVAVPQPSPSAQAVQPQVQSVEAVGLDELNNVQIIYGLSGEPNDLFGPWSQKQRELLDARVSTREYQLVSGPEVITIAGQHALRYTVRTASGIGYNVDLTWVGFLRGSTRFVVTCTSLPERTAEIQAGCEEILSTLQVVG
jgi:hypothetical protein